MIKTSLPGKKLMFQLCLLKIWAPQNSTGLGNWYHGLKESSLGIAPTFLKIRFVVAGDGFYSYYIH